MSWEDSVVLFDGECAFCDDAVRFVIARDRRGRFRYAPHRSAIGRALRAKHRVGDEDGVVLIENGCAHTRSSAVLRIARRLGWPWCWAYALLSVPRPLRDAAYRCFAHQRRRWQPRAVVVQAGPGAVV